MARVPALAGIWAGMAEVAARNSGVGLVDRAAREGVKSQRHRAAGGLVLADLSGRRGGLR
jgi:hypothetical protein